MQRTLSPHRECSNQTTRLTFSVVPSSPLAVRNLGNYVRTTLTYVLYHIYVGVFFCHLFILFKDSIRTLVRMI